MNRLPPLGADGRGHRIAGVAALALGQAAAAGVAAFATRTVFAAFGSPATAAPVEALLAIAGAGIAIAGLRWAESLAAERLGQDYVASLRLQLFDHVASMPASRVAQQRTGAMSLRFVGDLSAVRNWISRGLARLLSAGIVLPAAVGVLFALEPALAWAMLAPLTLGLLAICLLGPGLSTSHRRLRSRRARLASDVAERLPHAPELRRLGRMARERGRLVHRTRRLIDSVLDRRRRAALLESIPELVRGLGAASLLWTAYSKGISPASAAGALAVLALSMRPLRDLALMWDRRGAWIVARDRCEALLRAPTLAYRNVERRGASSRSISRDPPRLDLDGLILQDRGPIDAVVAPGRHIGITGPNGAGKSTLLGLLSGLESPAQGTIAVDGRQVMSLGADERRRLIAYVGPRSPILAGSLRRALTLGLRKRPADTRIESCARRFGLTELLARLGGLDGFVAESGRNLSAGERQRVLLVRAALSSAPLLLLDEPDEALDQAGRAMLRDFLCECPATALVVSHDPALLATMDEVWDFRDARVETSGRAETPAAATA